MNQNYRIYVSNARILVEGKGIQWDMKCDLLGFATAAWNLTANSGALPPPTIWFRDLGSDDRALEVLNVTRQQRGEDLLCKVALSDEWQELIKASVVNQTYIRRNTPAYVLGSIARPLIVLATCANTNEPWAVTAEDVARAFSTANAVQPSGKLADLVFGVIKTIIDANHLTDCGPLSPTLTRRKEFKGRRAKFAKASNNLASDLQDRKRAERLPDRRAFWELIRIVFTETPDSFLDLLRFALTKIMLLTGLRVGEAALMPADWKRVRDYFDANGRPAGDLGGYSRSLKLRHFAEKQRSANEDSVLLYEATQDILPIYEDILTEILEQVFTATEPLRCTLRAQWESGRMLPQFSEDALVPARDLYTYLSGNPFTYLTDQATRSRFVSTYETNFDPKVFDEIRAHEAQTRLKRYKLNLAANQFLLRLDRSLLRRPDGSAWDSSGPVKWDLAHIAVRDIEKHYQTNVQSKLSDLTPLRMATGENGQLPSHSLLFLMPKRALADGRNGGLCDVTRYFSVGRLDANMMTLCLCSPAHGTLFQKYGQTEDDRRLTLNPHSLRHLQNAELFREGLADTVISKRFNRRSIAQSHEYDHRSLSEALDQVDIPDDLEVRLGSKASVVARMIKSGRAHGPIISAFRKIQDSEGEDAAFEYLKLEADGFHSTPYGHCVNSFTVDPCPKHLQCFAGCRHLSATNLPEHRQNLVKLEGRLQDAVQSIQGRESASIGLANQLSHAQSLLTGVRKLLTTPDGQAAFPDGPDLSLVRTRQQEIVLDKEIEEERKDV